MNPSLEHKIKQHKAFSSFNYDLAVDWGIELIQDGIESENVLILASFSKPVDSQVIKPYVSAVMQELGMDENGPFKQPLSAISFYIYQIIEQKSIRENISELFELCLIYDHDYGLTPFYLIHFAWQDLEIDGSNHYYDGATLKNIETISVNEAILWTDKFLKIKTTQNNS